MSLEHEAASLIKLDSASVWVSLKSSSDTKTQSFASQPKSAKSRQIAAEICMAKYGTTGIVSDEGEGEEDDDDEDFRLSGSFQRNS